MQKKLPLLGFGALGLGLVGIAFGDFALQWQPVPGSLPLRQPLAIVAGGMLAVAGGLCLSASTRRRGAGALAVLFALWVVALKVPGVIAAPADLVAWLGLAEIGAMAAGSAALLSTELDKPSSVERLTVSCRVILGVSALIFGASHFVYAKFTAAMVPTLFPAPLFWAYLTGAGHAAAGLALVSGILSRVAALLLAIMCTTFAVFLHLPRVALAPTSHAEWVMLFVATSIAGASLAVSYAIGREGQLKSQT